ncbi:MAG: NusG domain II-containing protein [Erysipelotrichales bacterium]|nr:NusG domain II-containing protein [Erysipelotrichales bacterium]
MKRNDLILGVSVLLIGLLLFGFYLLQQSRSFENKRAEIFYRGELVASFRLGPESYADFSFEGRLGLIVVQIREYQVRVVEETSPRNLCSRQGFIQRVGEIIVCLPNEVFVRISGNLTNEIIVG